MDAIKFAEYLGRQLARATIKKAEPLGKQMLSGSPGGAAAPAQFAGKGLTGGEPAQFAGKGLMGGEPAQFAGKGLTGGTPNPPITQGVAQAPAPTPPKPTYGAVGSIPNYGPSTTSGLFNSSGGPAGVAQAPSQTSPITSPPNKLMHPGGGPAGVMSAPQSTTVTGLSNMK